MPSAASRRLTRWSRAHRESSVAAGDGCLSDPQEDRPDAHSGLMTAALIRPMGAIGFVSDVGMVVAIGVVLHLGATLQSGDAPFDRAGGAPAARAGRSHRRQGMGDAGRVFSDLHDELMHRPAIPPAPAA